MLNISFTHLFSLNGSHVIKNPHIPFYNSSEAL
jgi:hypothetical protein